MVKSWKYPRKEKVFSFLEGAAFHDESLLESFQRLAPKVRLIPIPWVDRSEKQSEKEQAEIRQQQKTKEKKKNGSEKNKVTKE